MAKWTKLLTIGLLLAVLPAHGTVTSQTVEVTSAYGNNSTTNYTISFPFLDNDDIDVYLVEGSTETLLIYGSGAGRYTITGGDPGTTVVMGTAPSTTQKVRIRRNSERTQAVNYDENAAFPFEDHEEQMDRTIMALQELATDVSAVSVGGVSTPIPTYLGGTGQNLAGSTGVLQVDNGYLSVSTIGDSRIASDAAIARSKIAASSIHGPVFNDQSGYLAASTVLPTNFGGTGLASPGTLNNVLTSDGTNWVSAAAQTGSSTTPSSWSGYHADNCQWTVNSGSYTDDDVDLSCTFVQKTSSDFNNVLTTGLADLVWTPKRAAYYKITASLARMASSGSVTCLVAMFDGSNNQIGGDMYTTLDANNVTVIGLLNVPSVASTTVKLRFLGTSCTFGGSVTNNTSAIYWTIEELR